MIYRVSTSPWSRSASAALVGVALTFGAMMAANAADVSVVATPKRSAVVPVKPEATGGEAQSGSLIVNVVGFEPPPTGSVQAVVTVKAATTGETHEIGRFGLFPNSQFKAKDVEEAQRFQLTLSPAAALLLKQQGKVSVELVPYGGDGEGARLEIGKIDLRTK
jgi:hypothetical protein